MNFFEKFIYFFQQTMTKPTIYGWYHILWLFILILICSLIITFRNKISQNAVRYSILIISISLILFEIMKQLTYSFNWNENTQTATWNYQWYAFPFQFCSTPMYLMFIAGICKKNLFRDSLYSYLATFALFGGLVVMLYPGDVFTTAIFINIHTMFWHASMVVVGFLIWATSSIEYTQKTFLKAFCVFLSMITLAMLANYIWKWSGGIETGQTFNMFYISPFYKSTLPLVSIIYNNAPYIIFLLCYIFGFSLAAYIITIVAIAINHTYLKHKNKKINKSSLK